MNEQGGVTTDPGRHQKNSKNTINTSTHINLTSVDEVDQLLEKNKLLFHPM